jgi:LmbE family N-acetylglucosaminyl deacetylase
MARRLERVRHFARSINFLRQQLGWQKLWRQANVSGLAPIVVDPKEKQRERTVLVLAPHPDDEVFGCGGALCYHRSLGDSITVLYLCLGDGGDPSKTKSGELAAQRRNEALKGLGLVDATAEFWDQKDGSLQPSPTLNAKLASVLDKVKPDLIYTPWLFDNHPDHIATTAILLSALSAQPIDCEVWQYEVWSPLVPNRFLPISGYLDQKNKLISCHQSQLSSRQYQAGIIGLNSYRGLQADLDGPAEAFLALPVSEFIKLSKEKA